MFKRAVKYDFLGIHESDSEDDDFDVNSFLNKRKPVYMGSDDEESEEDESDDDLGDDNEGDDEDADLSDEDSETQAPIPLTYEEKQQMLAESPYRCEICPHKWVVTEEQQKTHLASKVSVSFHSISFPMRRDPVDHGSRD